jgi:hypothetical protein
MPERLPDLNETPWGDILGARNGTGGILKVALNADGTLKAHAASHKSAGSDAIKLDELAAPTDVTTLNASTTAHGLLSKLPNDASVFLNGVGGFTAPADTLIANVQSGTTYTLVLTDSGKVVEFTNVGAVAVTIPTNAAVAFPVGTILEIAQMGAGIVTVSGAGVTLEGTLVTSGQFTSLALRKRATDEWIVGSGGGGGGAPSGAAGGVLAGSYPNPGMAAGAAVTNIGYTPVNKAGDTMTGNLTVPQLGLVGGNAPGNPIDVAIGSSWLMQNGAVPPPGYSPWQFTQTIQKTDGTGADPCYGISSLSVLGNGGVAAKATPIGMNSVVFIRGCGSTANEDAAYYGAVNVQIGTGFSQAIGPSGRHWFTDFSIYGPIGVQPGLLNGITMLANNYYNGAPIQNPSAAIWAVTRPGGGGSMDATHAAATTYPMDVGIGVVGTSTGGAGFTSAIKLGGTGSGWGATSRFTNALEIADYDTFGIKITGKYAGSTPSAAICVGAGTGPVLFGGTAAQTAGTLFEVQPGGTVDPLVSFGRFAASDSHSAQFINSVGVAKIVMAGGANAFFTGSTAGDAGFITAVAGKSVHLAGSVSTVKVTADNKLGVFNTTPVAQYATTGTSTGFTAGAGTTATHLSTFTGNTGATAYTVGDIVRALKLYGLVAA